MKRLLLFCILICCNATEIEDLVEELGTYFTNRLACTSNRATHIAKTGLPDDIQLLLSNLSTILQEVPRDKTLTKDSVVPMLSPEVLVPPPVVSEVNQPYNCDCVSTDETLAGETSTEDPKVQSLLDNIFGALSNPQDLEVTQPNNYCNCDPKGEDPQMLLVIESPNRNSPVTEELKETATFVPAQVAEATQSNNNCDCVVYYLCNDGVFNDHGESIFDIRFGDVNSCNSVYYRRCCNQIAKPSVPTFSRFSSSTPQACGVSNSNGVVFRVADKLKNEAHFAEFPWMIMVLKENEIEQTFMFECGGTLIYSQIVLTTAHCVKNVTSKYKIRAGDWDTQSDADTELYPLQDRHVTKVLLHGKFNPKWPFNDNIALLILDKPIEMAPNVGLICLPEQGQILDATKCIASGWGRDVNGTKNRNVLKKVDLPIVNREDCQKNLRTTRLGPKFTLDNKSICAGGRTDKDSCKSDGGGPLMCPISGSPDRYYQAGIIAWGISCGIEDLPGVYVNVALYVNWINDSLSKNWYDNNYSNN